MQESELTETELVAAIRENFLKVNARIEKAAAQAGRNGEDVRLVVVTKSQPVDVTLAAIRAGARYLGENYAEQAVPKIEALHTERGIEWHMIGHVQSRKARLVCEHFSMLHSLASLKLAEKMDATLAELGKELSVLLEFNLAGEESKHGWDAVNEADWDQLTFEIEAVINLPHLRVLGSMTMPPFAEDPEESRPYFRRLRRLNEYLAGRFPKVEWRELSMGTSGDFEVAVQEGATLVRVGQAIVGPRPAVRG